MTIESSILKLETLQKQFSLAMKQYKEAGATYKNLFNNAQSQKSFIKLPGYMYYANPTLNRKVVDNDKKCEALCGSDPKCKAATYYDFFNSDKLCITYVGINKPFPQESSGVKVTTILPNSSASRVYLEKINDINTLLLNIHSEIFNTLKKVNPDYQNVVYNTEIEGKNLQDIYMSLQDEKKRIDKLLKEYNTLEHSQTDSDLRSDSNYMHYRILLIVAVIVVFVTLKELVFPTFFSNGMTGGGKSSFYDLFFNFIFMILLLLLAQTFNNSAGYILWALFVLTYLFIKLKVFSKSK